MIEVYMDQRAVCPHQLKQKVIDPLSADAPSKTQFLRPNEATEHLSFICGLTKYHLCFRTSVPCQAYRLSE